MSTLNLDPVQLANMTDEERDALSEDLFSPEEIDALKDISEEGDDDATDVDAAIIEVVKDAVKADDVAPIETAAAQPVTVAEVAPQDTRTITPRFESKLPDDYQARVTAIKTREGELRESFKSGDIEIDEYEAGRDVLTAERENLLVARVKNEMSAEITTQTAEQEWHGVLSAFMKAESGKPGGIDYGKDNDKSADLDMFVKRLAMHPENSEKSMEWFIMSAHRRVLALHDIQVSKEPKPQEKPKSRKPDLSAVPVTLANVPGSDGPGDIGSEFSNLDALEGDALEAAIARMNPADRQKYASGR